MQKENFTNKYLTPKEICWDDRRNEMYIAFSWANVLKVTEKSHSFLKWTSPEKWALSQAVHLLSSGPQTCSVSHEIVSEGKLWPAPRRRFITFWYAFQKLKIGKTLYEKLSTSLCDESHWSKKILPFNILFTGQELKLGLSKRAPKNKSIKRFFSMMFSGYDFVHQGASWACD